MIDREYMRQIARDKGIFLEEAVLEGLDRYGELLVDWNQRMNLTGITLPKEVAVKHFLDSLLLLKAVEIPEGASLIDVGSGAGFPSVPCVLVRRDLRCTLLDSLNKRILFLQELTSQLGVEARCVHGRAEEWGRDPSYREQFQLATARAVAHLRELGEYCLPFVQVGGFFVALKGGDPEEEIAESKAALRQLGGRISAVKKEELPDGSGRSLIVIEKISQTSSKFPRPSAKMKKQPLC